MIKWHRGKRIGDYREETWSASAAGHRFFYVRNNTRGRWYAVIEYSDAYYYKELKDVTGLADARAKALEVFREYARDHAALWNDIVKALE